MSETGRQALCSDTLFSALVNEHGLFKCTDVSPDGFYLHAFAILDDIECEIYIPNEYVLFVTTSKFERRKEFGFTHKRK